MIRTSSALKLPQRSSSARGLTGVVLLITKFDAVRVISPVRVRTTTGNKRCRTVTKKYRGEQWRAQVFSNWLR